MRIQLAPLAIFFVLITAYIFLWEFAEMGARFIGGICVGWTTAALSHYIARRLDKRQRSVTRPYPPCPTCNSSTRDGMNAGRDAVDRGDGPEWCDDEWHDQAEMTGGGPS